MRKLFTLLTCCLLVFGLSACSGSNSSQSKSDENKHSSADSSAENSNANKSETPSVTGKTLVVYYSASGNTEKVANYIKDALGADIFEIEPAQEYTTEDLRWSNSESRVSREHDDSSLRDVPLKTTSVENWDSYSTVFIGYPIWWGIAAWPVDNFIKNNDFAGKTVIPFATSTSSGMGNSGKNLENMAGSGNWQDGKRFSSGASESEVKAWVDGLNL